MPAIFEYRHTVVAADLDVLDHANNLSYLKWMQDAALAHSAAQGWSGQQYRDLGAGWVVRSHQIEYRLPALLDDVVIVRTWVANLKKVTSLRRYEILRERDGAVLAVAATDWAFIDYASGAIKRVPPEISTAFEVVPDPARPLQGPATRPHC